MKSKHQAEGTNGVVVGKRRTENKDLKQILQSTKLSRFWAQWTKVFLDNDGTSKSKEFFIFAETGRNLF